MSRNKLILCIRLFCVCKRLNDIDKIFLRSLSVIKKAVRNFPLFRFPGKESGYCREISLISRNQLYFAKSAYKNKFLRHMRNFFLLYDLKCVDTGVCQIS